MFKADDIYTAVKYCLFYLESPTVPGKKSLFETTCNNMDLDSSLVLEKVSRVVGELDYELNFEKYKQEETSSE